MDYISSLFTSSETNNNELPVHEEGKDPYKSNNNDVEEVEETEELIKEKLEELEMELKKIPDEDKQEMLQANEQCSSTLIDDSFKLMFLRCESFNANLAAEKYVRYWKRRIEVFGKEKAFLPLTFNEGGACSDDMVAFQTGFIRLLPSRDPIGRSVVFVDPARQTPGQYPRESMIRVFWYIMHAALVDNVVTQKHGAVMIGFPKNVQFSQFDKELVRQNIGSVKAAIPIQMKVFHLCHPPSFFHILFPIIKFLLGAYLQRLIIHSGTTDEVLQRLSCFGFTKDKLPTELGGTIELDHLKWLEDRKSKGL